MNNNAIEVKISDIRIGPRHRKSMGDINELARSIKETGLLQPIGITPDNQLVFGERRLRAYRDVLNQETIPARVVAVNDVLHGEFTENMMRKEFTVSERVAIVEALRTFQHGGDRSSRDRKSKNPVSVADAAKRAGLGGKDGYARAKRVTEHGIPSLVEALDRGRIALSAAAVLAEAKPEEQELYLAATSGQSRLTAPSIERHLRYIREAEALEERQSVFRLSSPLALNTVTLGDCRELIPKLPDSSINLCVTSPPYADQRKGMYPGIPESGYAGFTADWMSKLREKLTDDGSVLIVIRPHLRKGVISDYVLRTRLALREAGWFECEKLIWHKTDGGACMGSYRRPRRAYEEILWFSKTHDPYIDTKECGHWEKNISFCGPTLKPKSNAIKKAGRTRTTDVISVLVGLTAKGVNHPAMFPQALASNLIRTYCKPGGVVLDNFAGSGNSLLSAKELGLPFYGFDVKQEYVKLANKRLE